MTFGTGAKVDVTDQVPVYGIYEATNDPQNFPRGVNSGDAFMSNFAVDDTDGYISRSDLMVNRVIEALNDPWIFGQPPYDGYYNLWKGKVVWRPLENVSISFTHAMNTNRNYAALLDDNHTHDAIDLMYRPFEKLNLRAGYSISRIMNIARARDTQGRDMQFRPHHNLYAQAEWDVKKDHVLTAQFGEAWIQGAQEGGVFASNYPSTRFSVLDTRSIFRVYYQGKF
jgi:hypothetical protein